MNRKRLIAITACAAIAAGVAGCGGDDGGGETTATATLTKEEWIQQADQICSTGDDTIRQAAQDAGLSNKSTPEEFTEFFTDTVLPNVEDQRDQIEALPIPEGEEDSINAITDALDQAITDSQANPGDSSTFKDVNKLAQDYGLTSCGSS